MTDKPILFSAPMVRALLDGRKTQTRRALKSRGKNRSSLFDGTWTDSYVLDPGNESWRQADIPIKTGDRLWCRETWQGLSLGDFQPTKSSQCEVRYAATDPCADLDTEARGYPWRPSIFMPRWASRITLIVTNVRVERLQDISEADARAEGCPVTWDGKPYDPPPLEVDSWQGYGRASYCLLWSKINGPGSWDANPWVAAYTFTVIKNNIDQVEVAA